MKQHILAEVDSARCVDLRAELANRFELASWDELRVMSTLLARLELGRQRYGYLDLSRDRRDWKRERAEEYIDLAIYDACDELDRAAKAAQPETRSGEIDNTRPR